VNCPDANLPASIGKPMEGVEIRIGSQDELLTRSPSVMLGYWENPEATASAIDAEGWLHTGDKACVDEQGYVFITGRIKDIIVLGNGEKLPPADMEMAIQLDPLFEQVMIIGEGRPFLSALVVLNHDLWPEVARELDVDPEREEDLNSRFVERHLLTRVHRHLKDFPGYARIRRLTPLRESWTVDDGLLTPTLKMKRERIAASLKDKVEAMYADYTDV
jgi:long-chain acyl-CoA synthetase